MRTRTPERARGGVRVRILYDAFGSRSTSGAYWRELRSYGVDVRPFRPIWTSGPIEAFSRDHRKLNASIDRKSTRLNSSHVRISYAVFCLKTKTIHAQRHPGVGDCVRLARHPPDSAH